MNEKPKKKVQPQQVWSKLWKQKWLFVMSVPVVIYLFVFSIIPLWGWVMAFFKYVPNRAFAEMDFVGFKYFIEAFQDERFWLALKNTLSMSLLNVAFSCFLCPIIFALFLNEMKSKGMKKGIQTISYLPHFVSWVVVAGIFSQLFRTSGTVNDILMNLGLIKERIDFVGNPAFFYAFVTIASVWKDLGWNAIIYISSMAGIDKEMYEAAAVDGAGRWRKMWNITLPSIRPTIMILLIINIGGVLGGGFEKQMLFRNALNVDKAMVLDLYVLEYGIGSMRYSFGTAVGIITSLTALILVFTTNRLSKKISGESIV